MKKQVFVLLFGMMVFSLTSGISQDKDWTLLIYLVGSDLESGGESGTNDLAEMKAAGSTNNVNVVVLTGGANKDGWRTPKSWLIKDGEQMPLEFQASDNAMSTPQNITDFVNWGIQNYPANKIMLTFWNHGADIRGYGVDETSNMQMSVPQITDAVGKTDYVKTGNRFEIIGFDACLMATLEVQSSLKDYGSYFIGSEETEPGHGWNYTPIIQAMEGGNATTGDVLGRIVVDGFKAQAEQEETSNVTLAIIDLSKISTLESTLETLFDRIKQDSKVRSLHKARGEAEEYSKSIKNPEYSEDMVDVGDLMKRLKSVDPDLSMEADAVLSAVKNAVIHNVKDMTRPLATGISMYIPHNVLVEEDETEAILNDKYSPINFSASVKDFIVNTYAPAAHSDNLPPSGETDPDFNFISQKRNYLRSGRGISNDSISAIRVSHDDDLEQVQVILVEEFEGFPNEYIMLGSTYPDTIVINPNGTETYAYKWDGYWLGINGYPAYITDIHDFELEDSLGNIHNYTRIHIPAIQNPGEENERDIVLAYRYDQDFNIVLESIVPEVYGDSVMITPKERIKLQKGEKVQLLYESYDFVADEWFEVVDESAIFTIVNGNEDLHLEYDELFEGNYHIGYVLMDHSQNDTVIFDSKVFVVSETSDITSFEENDIAMFPNPADRGITIESQEFLGKEFTVRLFDLNGRLCYHEKFNNPKVLIETSNLPNGYYRIVLISEQRIFSDNLIIQH